MNRPSLNRARVFYLVSIGFLLIILLAIGFGTAIVYNMAQLQTNSRDIYRRALSLSTAGSDMQTDLSVLRHLMLQIVASDPSSIEQLSKKIEAQDDKIHRDFSTVRAELTADTEIISVIERQMNAWHASRERLINLVRQGNRDKALKLGIAETVQLYNQLEANIDHTTTTTQQRVQALVADVNDSTAEITRLVWAFLGGLILSSILFGAAIINKIVMILEHDKETTRSLFESGERLKLALSGADEGTWDMEPQTGKLNFDNQWAAMLGYSIENSMPHSLEEWAALIYSEDRARVLKAMQDHVAGWTSEYKTEYRIRSGSGDLRWVVGHGRAVSREIDGRAVRVVGVTRDITQKKHAEERIWQLAHSDSLTGLPNRVSFYDRLSQSVSSAKRHNRKLAILFLDLDGFKQVNDRFGHDTGDKLLQEVANRLRQNIRGEDIVARTGGDEFIFILTDVTQTENTAIVANKIIRLLSEPFDIDGNSCQIGGSIGMAIYPDDSDNMETLVTQADNAMYKAKANGKGNCQFFNR